MRVNTSTNSVEVYSGSAWVVATGFPYTITYLVIAGGGAGGPAFGGFILPLFCGHSVCGFG